MRCNLFFPQSNPFTEGFFESTKLIFINFYLGPNKHAVIYILENKKCMNIFKPLMIFNLHLDF